MIALLEKKLDPIQLKEAMKLNWSSRIPAKYQVGDGSRSFTIRHILAIAKSHGIQHEVYSHFCLDEISFENKVDFQVSVQLASDILQFISSRLKLSDQDYVNLSFANAFYFKDSDFGKELSNSKNLREMYEKFLSVVNLVEENWEYEMQYADNKKIVLNSYSTEKQIEVFQRKDYSSYTFTKFRACMGAHLTNYLGLTGAKATITKSIHYGDDFCQFEIDLTDLRPLYV